MRCLLCDFQNEHNEELRNHCQHFHLDNKDNYFFKELFNTDRENKYFSGCDDCKISFQSCRKKSQFFNAS